MKTLKDLLNKELKAKKLLIPPCSRAILDMQLKRLQPANYIGEYERKNVFKVEELSNNKFKITCENYYQYTMPMQEDVKKSDVDFLYTSYKREFFEKINRDLHTFGNFEYITEIKEQKTEETTGMLKFRAGGDYVFNNCYGEKLKANDLIKNEQGEIIGFKKQDFYNNTIKYLFMEA